MTTSVPEENLSCPLASLRSRLRPGGAIVLTVPAFPFLWSNHDVSHHHFRRYTRESLRASAEKAGLKVSYSSYYNFFLFPVAVAARTVKRLTGRKTPDDALPGPLANGALRRVFGFERHLLGRLSLPFGLSLVAVLEPS